MAGDLPGPVAVAYEAGPTGFGLSRALTAAGIRCEVAAPVEAAATRRVTGSRPTPRTRSTWPGCCAWTRSPRWRSPRVEQEAARDLVRAREDCRGDLMRARHRLSKLLLRHGIVYSGGQAWTGSPRRLAAPGRRVELRRAGDAAGLRVRLRRGADGQARRDRLDAAIAAMAADSEFTPMVRRLGCLRGIGTLTGFALAVEIGDWDRFTGNTIGSFVGLVPTEYSSGASRVQGVDHQDRQHPRPPAAGRGRLAPPAPLRGRQDHARPLGAGPAGRPGPRRRRATGDCTTAGSGSSSARKRPRVANVAIARELAGWCWSLAVLDD